MGKDREYGNKPQQLRWAAIGGLVIGSFTAICVLSAAYHSGPLDMRALGFASLALIGIPAIVMVAVFLTCLFSIRLHDGRVQHVFLGRHILSDYPISEFVRYGRYERGCAVVLHFTEGRKIHFLGAHTGELKRLYSDIIEATRQPPG